MAAGERRLRVTTRLNLRRGAPRLDSPRVATMNPGTVLAISKVVTGDPVDGDSAWIATPDGNFAWCGGGRIEAGAAAPSPRHAVPPVIDLYHRNSITDFAKARAAGVRGIIHKASTGATGRDPRYAERRAAARAAGLLWGAYHWGNGRDPADQVENFLAAAMPDDATLVALDYEVDPASQMSIDGARAFLERLHERLGRRGVLYSGHLIKESLGDAADPFFGAHRLWLAQYGPRPSLQPSWSSYWLWQFSDGPASIPGIPGDAAGHVDRNRFGGTAEQLADEWAR
ncbi:GH25 family lysozyme [Sphingomonas sp. RS6]